MKDMKNIGLGGLFICFLALTIYLVFSEVFMYAILTGTISLVLLILFVMDVFSSKDEYSIYNSVLNNINDLNGIKLGILASDLENIKYYLNEADDITYVACESIDEMLNKINSQTQEIEYMAIPKMMYLDDILTNDLNIVYHISELYKRYVIH